jgi:hypothetical protein
VDFAGCACSAGSTDSADAKRIGYRTLMARLILNEDAAHLAVVVVEDLGAGVCAVDLTGHHGGLSQEEGKDSWKVFHVFNSYDEICECYFQVLDVGNYEGIYVL